MRNVLIVILFVMVMSNCSTKDSDIFVEPIDTPTTGPTELVITTSYNEIPLDGKSWEIISRTMYQEHGNHMYTIGSDRYLLLPGSGYNDSTGEKGSPMLFKEINGEWKFIKIFLSVETEDIRNFRQIDDTTFLWGGASENDRSTCNCGNLVGRQNNIWLVKVVTDDVIFTQINTETSWFHDISFGDLDNDGLFDVLWNSRSVYFQNPNGTFRLEQDVFPETGGTVYFSVEIGDLFGDSKPEVVKVAYLNTQYDWQKNGFIVYQFNETTRKMEEVLRKQNPFLTGDYGGNNTRIIDINNDGFNDLIISREGEWTSDGDKHHRPIEVWMGDGTKNLRPTDIIGDNKKFNILNTNLLDVNGDGYLDIILGGRNGSVWLSPYENRRREGFRLNDLIWINDGTGKFKNYTKSELIGGKDMNPFGKFLPYMKDGNLTFFGESFNNPENGFARTYINEVIIKNL